MKSKLLKQIFDALETIYLTLVSMLKIFASLFPLPIWRKMKGKENFKQWFNVFVVISEALQGVWIESVGSFNLPFQITTQKVQ